MAGKCPRCEVEHDLLRCPYVKAVEFEHPGDLASIRRVEFLTPADCAVAQQRPKDEPAAADYPRKGSK